MIKPDEIQQMIQNSLPDAEIEITDRTGEQNHYIVHVTSERFKDANLLDQNRMVYYAVNPAMIDGRLHAIEIKTHLPEEKN